ncbi:unnamed protein product [Polarella glacialis]|uniref:EF-hand domain-containing protein n=1 Tax=Polarella glacialis TaxID=89957 RepID=A0A813K4S3_POLGL|nr:unnamed protein product [Polarella glacialis]|mmetsp:Transcript_30128/g.48339  ORF Transcript_30128/g.48339 Transcript_30128/m.48339 type:complete len:1130 (-) Transcript_30128:250-3639(-)|eukprot:CAMPEP_0115078820 /NCGR_PEP_ID=MMETSP0227-20121206/17763_1 /TAXON_ID=89957 /ORGANISM="Polarella glacialis, Strain CCMP 1383" /LENGTH=1129 /DNA_ID=CAMNT_0002466251 /DNA_START=107 /DNA_END=3496 /DNA_ORIENTATION=+
MPSPAEATDVAVAPTAGRTALVTSSGDTLFVDELRVPDSLKKVIQQLDFEQTGRLTDANLENAAQMLSSLRVGLDKDGSGNVTNEELMAGITLLSDLKAAAKDNSGDMSYLHLPEKIRTVMAEWDVDGSGKIGHQELHAAAQAHQQMKKEGRLMKKIILGMAIVILLLMASMFVLSYLAVDMAKEMRGDSSGTMKTASGSVVSVGSYEYSVDENGRIVPKASGNTSRRLMGTDGMAQPVTMSTAHTAFGISSRLSNKQLQELTAFSLELTAGDSRQIRVSAWKRVPQVGAHHCGSVVQLTTDEGVFTLDDYDLFYEGNDEHILEKYGASNEEVIANWKDDEDDSEAGRRLAIQQGRQPIRRLSEAAKSGRIRGRRLSAAAMAGMYNSIAAAAEEFSCVILADDGTEVVVVPPPPPTAPYSFVSEFEGICVVGPKMDEDMCTSSGDGTSGLLSPGAQEHKDGTKTMRSFQSVLMLKDMSVTVSYYPSHPMQRKIEVSDYTSKKKRNYVLFGTPDGSQKLHCVLDDMTQKELDEKMKTQDIDLAFLGMTKDGTGKDYLRWNIAQKGATNRPGEAQSSIEFWEDRVSRTPYRMFMPGPTEIAPNVKAAVFFSPMRIAKFKQNLSIDDALQWLNSTLGETSSSSVTDIMKGLMTSCDDMKKVLVTGTEPMKVPAVSGAYGEEAATWYADRMTEMDAIDTDDYLAGPADVRGIFQWPTSMKAYWSKLKEARKTVVMNKMMLQAMQASSQCAANASTPATSGGRRMGAVMNSIVLPKFIAEGLMGDGAVLEFGASSQCLKARATKGLKKPPWAASFGVDIDVQASLEYCWAPQFYMEGEIFIQITKGQCFDLPYIVPKYNMAAAYVTGFLRLKGGTPKINNCQIVEHGWLQGVLEMEALVGIYNDDDSWRSCDCDHCSPADWPNTPDNMRMQCGCERTAPGHASDRRRGWEHDYFQETGNPGGWEETGHRRRSEVRRRRRRGGHECPQCYQNPPAFDIGAMINAQFDIKFSEFSPNYGSNPGVDITGSINVKARVTFLGFDFEWALIKDLVIFNANNAFQLGGSVCRRRLDGSNSSVENFDEDIDMKGPWICEDTCAHANDGHCDDGGEGSKFSLCGLGTDCNDCGTRRAPYAIA